VPPPPILHSLFLLTSFKPRRQTFLPQVLLKLRFFDLDPVVSSERFPSHTNSFPVNWSWLSRAPWIHRILPRRFRPFSASVGRPPPTPHNPPTHPTPPPPPPPPSKKAAQPSCRTQRSKVLPWLVPVRSERAPLTIGLPVGRLFHVF